MSYDFYVEAAQIVDPHRKRALLLHLGGDQLQQVYRNLPVEMAGPVDVYTATVQQLDKYFATLRNETVETDKF